MGQICLPNIVAGLARLEITLISAGYRQKYPYIGLYPYISLNMVHICAA